MGIKESIQNDGYVIIKNAISDISIEQLRANTLEYYDKNNAGFFYLKGSKVVANAFNMKGMENVSLVLKNKVITNALKKITNEDIVYANHSSVTCNAKVNWHRDCIAKSEYDLYNTSKQKSQYGLYKVLIYLQDQLETDYAIRVKKGSQHSAIWQENNEATLHLKAGDALIIDLRVLHGGNIGAKPNKLFTLICGKIFPEPIKIDITTAYIINYFLKKIISPKVHYKILAVWRSIFLPKKKDRLLITYSFGKDDHFTQEHVLKHVAMITKGGNNIHESYYISPSTLKHLKAVGIKPFDYSINKKSKPIFQKNIKPSKESSVSV